MYVFRTPRKTFHDSAEKFTRSFIYYYSIFKLALLPYAEIFTLEEDSFSPWAI